MSSTSDYGDTTWHDYGRYISQTARLNSFNKWSKKSKRTPEELSHAGFFYRGKGQQVFCFSCGKLLFANKPEKWQAEYDIWMLHAQLDIQCPYLTMVKGTDYIEAARQADYNIRVKKYEERKRAEKRKAERDEKKLKAKRAEKKMESEPVEKEMKETPIDQHV